MGHSRFRISLFLSAFIALFFLITILSLSVDTPQERSPHWYERVYLGALSPFQKLATGLGTSVRRVFDNYFSLVDLKAENIQLKQQVDQLTSRVMRYEAFVAENDRLRRLLDFREGKPWQTITARVIGYNPQAEFRFLTINKGSADGLKLRMPVMAPQGLLGQVYRLSAHSAQILIISDPTSAVDVSLSGGGARGILRGRVQYTAWDRQYFISAMEYVDRLALIPNEAKVVTSGFDEIFPAGIPVGKVRKVKADSYGIFQEAEVVPFVDMMDVREVMVLISWDTP